MGGLVIMWLTAEGIVTYRWVKAGAPPTPGSLLAVSGFFALLAVVAQYPPARTFATITAAGINIAALLQVLPGTHAPQANTGWPPPVITDGTIILPTGHSHGSTSNPSGGGGPGAAVPSGPNTLPPGTPPPPNQGPVFPPGSGNL